MPNTDNGASNQKPHKLKDACRRLHNDLATSLGFSLLTLWTIYVSIAQFPNIAAGILAVTSIIALLVAAFYDEPHPSEAKLPKLGLVSAVALFGFIIVGLFGANAHVSALVPIPYDGGGFVTSNRERWEVVALMSTVYMAVVYYDAVKDISHVFGGDDLRTRDAVLLLSLAMGLIFVALWALHTPVWHYPLVLCVAIVFAAIDFAIWRGGRGKLRDERAVAFVKDARMLFFLLDIPVVLGLAVLTFYFLVVLGCTTEHLNLAGSVPNDYTYKKVLQTTCIEAHPFRQARLHFRCSRLT